MTNLADGIITFPNGSILRVGLENHPSPDLLSAIQAQPRHLQYLYLQHVRCSKKTCWCKSPPVDKGEIMHPLFPPVDISL